MGDLQRVDMRMEVSMFSTMRREGCYILYQVWDICDSVEVLLTVIGLVKPVRTVSFSPAGTRLAAAGDSKVIGLYDVQHGEQVANLTGHSAWVFSVDWSDTGEYLLSGSFDGKVKVWSIDTRNCVATHSETDKTLWCVKWLPKT